MDFAFKCHREENSGNKSAQVYSLNAITFNRVHSTFATVGADGFYYTWNKDTKSKYKSSKKFPASLSAADFSDDGSMLCYAMGYDYSKGHEGAKLQTC